MHTPPFFFSLFLLFFSATAAPAPAPAPGPAAVSADARALLALRSAVDPGHRLPFTGPDHCRWPGVTCTAASGHRRVTRLVLEGRRLRGTVPAAALARLPELRLLSLKNNSLSGPLPDFSPLPNLKALFLSHNRLSGALPFSLLRLGRLRALDVSGNALSGPVLPLNQSTLLTVDFSDNDFSGPVPVTPAFLRVGPSAFAGNPGLCGLPVGRACPPSSPSPSPSPTVSYNLVSGNHSGRRIAAAVGVAAGAVLVIGVAAVCVVARRRHGQGFRLMKPSSPPASGQDEDRTTTAATRMGSGRGSRLMKSSSPPASSADEGRTTMRTGRGLVFCAGEEAVFTVEELMKAAADLMGKGTVGSTYKAAVTAEMTVSVKRVDRGRLTAAGTEAFERQMDAVGRLRHPNIVPLRAFVEADDDRLLVFEYQTNGSLFSLIHGSKSTRSTAFHWTSCLKIAEDVAQGLACFHQTPGLVHGGIKSSNVLLGNDFEARLVDGGLAQLIHRSNDVGGPAAAYRAPEIVGRGGEITPKVDIYAFGVLLLELLAGRPPPTVLPSSPEGLAAWVRSGRDDSADEDERVMMLIGVAVACVRVSPEGRPTAWQVMRMLQEVKEADADDDADAVVDNGGGLA